MKVDEHGCFFSCDFLEFSREYFRIGFWEWEEMEENERNGKQGRKERDITEIQNLKLDEDVVLDIELKKWDKSGKSFTCIIWWFNS